MRRITQSAHQTMLRCEEKARLKYIEKLATPGSQPMTLGSAVHHGIEHRSAAAAVEYLVNDYGATWTPGEQDSLEVDKAIVAAMVSGALTKWFHWPSMQEVEFDIPLRNPATGRSSTRHTFAGKIDGVFPADEAPGGYAPVLMELKTAGRLDSSYLERLDLDWEVTAYLVAASEVFSVPVRTMHYRIIRKPSIRPRKKVKRDASFSPVGFSPEAPEEFAARVTQDYLDRPDFYFEERIITRSEAEIERWHYEAWELHERFLRIENGGMTVRNPNECLAFKKPCAFWDLCRGVVGPEALAVQKTAHPELEGTTNE